MKAYSERHFDLSIKFQDGTYHNPEHPTKDQALERLAKIRKDAPYVRLWEVLDWVDPDNHAVRPLMIALLLSEGDFSHG